MILPNAERAEIDLRKLTDYLLNPSHFRGRNKALIWQSALGVTAADARKLRRVLLDMVKISDAEIGVVDAWGQRYTVDLRLEWQGRSAIIRTGWIIASGTEVPKLTTAYPR